MAACIPQLKKSNERSMIYELIDQVLDIGVIPSDTFLITASAKAGIDNIVESTGSNKSDTNNNFLPYIGDYISQKLSLPGKSLHISAACASSTVAIAKGAALIENGRYDSVLICCFDLVTEFIFSGFCSLQAMSPFPCKPFDIDRKGMSIGEGAAALLLMSPEKAKKANKTPMGALLGWAVTNDATHITGPDVEGSGLALAVKKSLAKAGIASDSVSAMCAHGTGTIYNDLMEIAAYKMVFGNKQMPIFSVKGAIGHTLGAAGGIETALSLKCLSHGIIPPTAGFSVPEKGAEDLVSSKSVKTDITYILCTNSGFTGVNGALVMEKEAC